MDLSSKISGVISNSGGRILCSQLVAEFQPDLMKDNDWRRLFKKAVASVAIVEQGEDKRKYLVLKELARNKENITNINSVHCQSTQTPTNQPAREAAIKRRTSNRTTVASSSEKARSSTYSAYTSKEPHQWWVACSEGRLADMQRLLGLNPKLVNWSNPVDGWTAMHYAAKTSNIQCMRLLVKQYHADVNAPSRNGQTPLHIAVLHSNATAIRQLIEEFKANPAIMDFSGRYPVSLLSAELREEFVVLLTAGHLSRIRDALRILPPNRRTRCDTETVSFLSPGDASIDFKRPALPPRAVSKNDTLFRTHTSDVLRNPSLRSSTLSLSDNHSRRASAFTSLFHTMANAAHIPHEMATTTRLSTLSPTLSFQRERSMLLAPIATESLTSKGNSCAPGSSLDSSGSSDIVPLTRSNRSLTNSHEDYHTTLLLRKLPKCTPGPVDPNLLVTLLSLLPPSPPESEAKHQSKTFRNLFKIPRPSSVHITNDKCPSTLLYTANLAEMNLHTVASNIRRKNSVKSLTYEVENLRFNRLSSSPSCQSLAVFSSSTPRCRSVDHHSSGL